MTLGKKNRSNTIKIFWYDKYAEQEELDEVDPKILDLFNLGRNDSILKRK